ncbi:IclR family transcriptional regulator [Herbiconiux sp. CPCC 205716]|uniref:IclR family transcriptional regulator n=1 Tax=Herbiconiux gentiana TaxID=2970912 RepID=A0ABT2GBI4_9MICO|nr:IclR family transcriptional regulator [Herbiconiux gentiana]MCS5713563.1 IclR family transcriptional regulator [Herbiconiux gentiana]
MIANDENEPAAAAAAEPQRTKGVDSARRALQILLEFSESTPELTVDNVLEKHDISVPSAYRYISLLRELDLIEEREKGRFVLSPQILRLSRAAESVIDFRAQVQPILNRMAEETGETALYLRRVNDSAVCLAIAESDHPISISFQPGALMPLYGGAAAKLLLSELPPAKLAQYFNRLGPVLSKSSRKKLEDDLDAMRSTGYAESAGEVDRGVWASAASVQTSGVSVGALTIVAPDYRLSDEHKTQIAETVRAGAKAFREAIAHRA